MVGWQAETAVRKKGRTFARTYFVDECGLVVAPAFGLLRHDERDKHLVVRDEDGEEDLALEVVWRDEPLDIHEGEAGTQAGVQADLLRRADPVADHDAIGVGLELREARGDFLRELARRGGPVVLHGDRGWDGGDELRLRGIVLGGLLVVVGQ